MRISDWSSDVCSSDLPAKMLHDQLNAPFTPDLQDHPFVEAIYFGVLTCQPGIRIGIGRRYIQRGHPYPVAQQPYRLIEIGLLQISCLCIRLGVDQQHFGIPEYRRSVEHTHETQSLERISYAVLCMKK